MTALHGHVFWSEESTAQTDVTVFLFAYLGLIGVSGDHAVTVSVLLGVGQLLGRLVFVVPYVQLRRKLIWILEQLHTRLKVSFGVNKYFFFN